MATRWYTLEDIHCLPAGPGSYVLELELLEAISIRAGRLGLIQLGPGRLRYYGSACGPGGLRARVSRHLQREGRLSHWHIDALTAVAPVSRVTISRGRTECDLVQRDLKTGRWVTAATGFGSSDCQRCPAHLLAETETTGLATVAKPVRR